MTVKAVFKPCVITLFAAAGLTGCAGSERTIAFQGESQLQEVVFSVSDVERVLPAYTEVMEWDVIYRGRVSADMTSLCSLPADTHIDEVLLASPDSPAGHVRLVQFHGVEQQPISPGAHYCDTGGLFNINFQVRDLDATMEGLRSYGWFARGFSESYGSNFNEDVAGKSTVMVGPDDIVFSFQQRIRPPLEGYPPFTGASHVGSIYEIVDDTETWKRFYVDTLGFAFRGEWDRRSEEPIGPNDYGLPHHAVGMQDQ